MKTKTSSKPQYSPETKELAREGHYLAILLWRKILANCPTDVKEILHVHQALFLAWDRVEPSEFERVLPNAHTHENLLENTKKAKEILTGVKELSPHNS